MQVNILVDRCADYLTDKDRDVWGLLSQASTKLIASIFQEGSFAGNQKTSSNNISLRKFYTNF